MTTNNRSVQDDDVRRENARIGYQAAINLWMYEGATSWARLNVMVVANSIIIGAISLLLINQHPLAILIVSLTILGLVLCITWLSLIMRSFDYHDYWVLSARELEELYLADSIQTVSRGGSFASGNTVQIKIGNNHRNLKMNVLSRIKVRWISYIIISTFIGVYIILFLTLFVAK